jgi:hypothetical protein
MGHVAARIAEVLDPNGYRSVDPRMGTFDLRSIAAGGR